MQSHGTLGEDEYPIHDQKKNPILNAAMKRLLYGLFLLAVIVGISLTFPPVWDFAVIMTAIAGYTFLLWRSGLPVPKH